MVRDLLSAFDGAGTTTFFLVEPGLETSRIGKEFIEAVDDEIGIQARIEVDTAEPPTDWSHVVLNEAKAKSRWGKDLISYYRDFLSELAAALEDRDDGIEYIANQYDRFDADAFDSGAIGEELSLGIDVHEELVAIIEQWGTRELVFNSNDLRAAIGYALERLDVAPECSGYLAFEFTSDLSDLEPTLAGELAKAIHEFQLVNLNVAVFLSHEPGAKGLVRRHFRRLGKFDFESIGETPLDEETVREVNRWLEEWYDDLCYEVESPRIRGEVAAKAGATATELRETPNGAVFADALEFGLLRSYSGAKLRDKHGDDFEDLWKENVTGRDEYDRWNSKRADFPHVTVARSDGLKQDFELRIGPSGRVSINDVPIPEHREPLKVFINTIDRFLEADVIPEDRWVELKENYSRIFPSTDGSSSTVLWALLSIGLLPPENPPLASPERPQSTAGYEREWFEEHWKAILSTFKLSSLAGRGIIRGKQNLKKELSLQYPGEVYIYKKVERDLNAAGEYFRGEIESRIREILPSSLRCDVAAETGDTDVLSFSASDRQGHTADVEVEIEIPYLEIAVNGKRIDSPTISNVVQEIVREMDELWYYDTPSSPISGADESRKLYELLALYTEIKDAEEGKLVYFDDFANFCARLPEVVEWAQSKSAPASTDDFVLERMSDEEFVDRLRNQGVTFHRKGNDPRKPIQVQSGNKYIAFEMTGPLD